MKKLKVTLELFSNALHSEQAITGLCMLGQLGEIDLELKINSQNINYQRGLGLPIVRLKIENDDIICNVLIDASDSHNLIEIDELTEDVNFYFKRSFHKDGYAQVNNKISIHPLGFNYSLFGKNNYVLKRLKLCPSFKNQLEYLLRNNQVLSYMFRVNNSIANRNLRNLYDTPHDDGESIIFMTRLWDEDRARNQYERERRIHLNYIRTETVRALKRNFGSRFIGGLFIDDYSKRHANDCLLYSNEMAQQRNYIPLLKRSAIAVCCNGIHSVGWSMGEYIAMSKCIVCDPLMDIVPGNFRANHNYLEFKTPEKAVERCETLLLSRDLRDQMRISNNLYYHSNLRPDSLMRNVISQMGLK